MKMRQNVPKIHIFMFHMDFWPANMDLEKQDILPSSTVLLAILLCKL